MRSKSSVGFAEDFCFEGLLRTSGSGFRVVFTVFIGSGLLTMLAPFVHGACASRGS